MSLLYSINKIKYRFEPFYNRFAKWCITLFYNFPVQKNKIVFVNRDGEGYACNPKYVAEEIIHQKLSYDMVWMVNQMSESIPRQIRRVKFNRIKAIYELATAHFIITNSKSLLPIKKKNNHIFIYIPHGQPGCKCAEGDAKLANDYLMISKSHSAMTDVFVSMGSYHTQVLKETFWVPKHSKTWEIGFPRNDQYYRDMTQKQQEIRSKLNIPKNTHIVLYAPTFRDNNTIEAYNLDLHQTIQALEQKTGDKWIMFITLHPNFKWYKIPPYTFDDKVWNLSYYLDIHELLLVVDVVISDYSSISLDFVNTRRPVFLYASDIEEYSKMRGLKPMFFKLPFPLCKTNEELINAIMTFDKEVYNQNLGTFQKLYGSVDDGHAAERFVNHLNIIASERK